jgi:hypothetical protein
VREQRFRFNRLRLYTLLTFGYYKTTSEKRICFLVSHTADLLWGKIIDCAMKGT